MLGKKHYNSLIDNRLGKNSQLQLIHWAQKLTKGVSTRHVHHENHEQKEHKSYLEKR